jgi:hypothetical protein
VCRCRSFECGAVVAGWFDEYLEAGRGVSGTPLCVEVGVPCVVY